MYTASHIEVNKYFNFRRFPEGTHYSKTCPNIGTFCTDKNSVITTNTAAVTTVSTAATLTSTGSSTANTDSSVVTTTSNASTATVNVTGNTSTFTTSSTAAIMNTSMASASTLTLIDVASIKPELGEASTNAILNTSSPISEVNYALTKSSSAKTTLSNLSNNKNTISVINISEQLEAGLENNSAHVNLIEQLSASGSTSTPTQVFVQPVNNCPSRVVVHLDSAGQIIPLSVPLHFLDPNLQFFQTDPMQVIQTVTVPSQNVINSYDNSTF